MVTIYDIAEKSGFAAGTVSKALNNYYGVNFSRIPSSVALFKSALAPNATARVRR